MPGKLVRTFTMVLGVVASSSCGTSSNGNVGADGSANQTLNMSPGRVTIELTIAGTDSYCQQTQCGSWQAIYITDASGNALSSARECATACDTCTQSPCPGYACQPSGIDTSGGATITWDGRYSETSVCGANVTCDRAVYAAPGPYVAVMCATPGKLVPPEGGTEPLQCVATGQPRCIKVPFDFPSSGMVKGTIDGSTDGG